MYPTRYGSNVGYQYQIRKRKRERERGTVLIYLVVLARVRVTSISRPGHTHNPQGTVLMYISSNSESQTATDMRGRTLSHRLNSRECHHMRPSGDHRPQYHTYVRATHPTHQRSVCLRHSRSIRHGTQDTLSVCHRPATSTPCAYACECRTTSWPEWWWVPPTLPIYLTHGCV